jgi:hypothetical protein
MYWYLGTYMIQCSHVSRYLDLESTYMSSVRYRYNFVPLTSQESQGDRQHGGNMSPFGSENVYVVVDKRFLYLNFFN